MRILARALALAVMLAVPGAGDAAALALDTFPGAVGHGRATAGGRGGAVFVVSNLKDSGAGSLRACMVAAGPRTCVFRVSGTMDLLGPIFVTEPFLTVAGQTSPGGVQLRLKPGIAATAAKTPVIIRTDEVFLRHLRIRPGNQAAWAATRGSRSGLGIERAGAVHPTNIYLDHLSVGYGSDQAVYAYQSGRDITVANSLFAYPLSPAAHDYGPLFCADQHRGVCERITVWRNVMAGHRWRNPALKGIGCGGAHDVVNNLISNPGQLGIQVADDHPDAAGVGTCANIAANIFERGPKSTGPIALVNQQDDTAAANRWYAPVGTGGPHDNLLLGSPPPPTCRKAALNPVTPCTEAGEPLPVGPLSVPVVSTANLKADLLRRAGAWPRDTLDAAWVSYAANVATAPAINPAYTTATSYPTMGTGSAGIDSDADGMPNSFENANGLDSADPADRNVVVPGGLYAGYTYLERYLDERHHAVAPP